MERIRYHVLFTGVAILRALIIFTILLGSAALGFAALVGLAFVGQMLGAY